jgi:hypothetical protein
MMPTEIPIYSRAEQWLGDKPMDDKRIYNVWVRPAKFTVANAAFRLAVFFGILICFVGISRVWFGGAWVIDICAVIVGFSALYTLPKRVGNNVRMTRAEMKAWVEAGFPDTWGHGD